MEQRHDVYVSSLRPYTETVVERLNIVAEFAEGEVTITNFSDLGEAEPDPWG